MKILVDEMCDGWVLKLMSYGYKEVYGVKKLRRDGHIGVGHRSVIDYAHEHSMVVVTRDKKFRKDPLALKIQSILPDVYLFDIVLEKLSKHGGPRKEASKPNETYL